MARILSVIAPEGFQDVEYGDSRNVLEEKGHEVSTASTEPMAVGKFGKEVEVDLLIDQVYVDDFDAVLFVGGPGVYDLFGDEEVLHLAREFAKDDKLVTAICAAPSILANAGLLEGKNVTSFSGESENLEKHGAKYTGNPVEVDELIITADGPNSAEAFGEAISDAL
jgi:protease I